MPLSDWQPLPIVTTGDMWTAAQHNTYIRQNQQVLRDALALGHGQGSDVDMVDGRHSTDLVWNDYGVVGLGAGWHWVTVLEMDWYSTALVNIFADYPVYTNVIGVVAKHGYPAVTWRTLAASQHYGDFRIYAVRLWQHPSNSQLARLQAYVNAGGGTVLRAQVANIGLEYQKTVPSRKAVLVMQTEDLAAAGWYLVGTWVVQNGSWRLARAYAGSGGTAGWLTATQKQNLFTVTGSGWTYFSASGCIDSGYPNHGATGAYNSNAGGGGNVYLDAGQDIPIDGVRIGASGSDYTGKIYIWDTQNNTWQQVASWGGANYTGDYEITWPTPYITPKLRVEFANYGDGIAYLNEIHVRLHATIVLQGVPVGCKVRMYNAAGTLLEEKRNDAWMGDTERLAFTSPPSDIAKIEITCPDGTTPWLSYPTWAIDGWDPSGWQVLTLYSET